MIYKMMVGCLVIAVLLTGAKSALFVEDQPIGRFVSSGDNLTMNKAGDAIPVGRETMTGVRLATAKFHPALPTSPQTLAAAQNLTPTVYSGAKTWGGSASGAQANKLSVDGAGNLYVAGEYTGTVDFNPGGGAAHASNGAQDAFLSKFDSSGNFQWVKTWGGTGRDVSNSMGVDSSGNVYVFGIFVNTVDFNPAGGATHSSNAGSMNNVFLSKFAADGTFQWVKTWGPTDGGAEGYSIAIDGSNNVYAVGDFTGSQCDFNPWNSPHDVHPNHPTPPGSLFGPWLFDAYLSKFDSNGNFIWAKTWGGEGYDDGPGVAVDSLGNVYVGGMYASQTINFDPAGGSGGLGHPAHDSGIMVDVFFSKFNSSGTFQWVKTWGGTGTEEVGQAVTVDGLNNVYVGGRFGCANCDFNPGGIAAFHSSQGDVDAFISKFDASGTFQWAKTWGGKGKDVTAGVTSDGSNNVYVTGIFSNTVDFGSGSEVSSHGLWDVFLSKFDSNGNFQEAQTWGGPGNDGGNTIARNAAGNVYVAGWFSGSVDFDPGSGVDNHAASGVKDAFVSKFLPSLLVYLPLVQR